MSFEKSYTTHEKKMIDLLKAEKDQTEQTKIELSNDAFALGNVIQDLINKIEHTRVSLKS